MYNLLGNKKNQLCLCELPSFVLSIEIALVELFTIFPSSYFQASQQVAVCGNRVKVTRLYVDLHLHVCAQSRECMCVSLLCQFLMDSTRVQRRPSPFTYLALIVNRQHFRSGLHCWRLTLEAGPLQVRTRTWEKPWKSNCVAATVGTS